jgi:hypothetical protein
MRIAWIGGVERNEGDLIGLAAKAGHELDFHGGHMGGRGTAELYRAVERADLVVILTDVNSHGAVQIARKLCRQIGRPMMLTRRCGASRFQRFLEELDVERLRKAS